MQPFKFLTIVLCLILPNKVFGQVGSDQNIGVVTGGGIAIGAVNCNGSTGTSTQVLQGGVPCTWTGAPTLSTSLTNPLLIGGTGTTSTLTIQATSGNGTTGADIIVKGGNNGATELMRVLANGDVGVGISNPTYTLQAYNNIDGNLFKLESDTLALDARWTTYRNSTGQVQLVPQFSRGSKSSPSIVQNNDLIFLFSAQGYDGGTFATAAQMHYEIDGAPGSGSMPGRISFLTTPSGSATAIERWRINSTGQFLASTDNSWDIGASGATRPRTGYFATSLISPLFRSDNSKVLLQGSGSNATQVASTQTTPPSCSSNCGTSVPTQVGTDSDMIITMGSGGSPASGFVVTFNGTWAAAPSCVGSMAKTGMVVGKIPLTIVTTQTTMTVVTNGTAPSTSDVYAFICRGVQ